MEPPALLNRSRSDFSEASIVSLGHSTRTDVDSETTSLLAGTIQSHHTDVVRPGTSWYTSILLVLNAALGAGLLNFPAAYHQCGGIVVAISIQALLAVFVVGSMFILIYCAEVHNCSTYQDVIHACCGRTARILCSIGIALYSFGTCIAFFIIIGDQWNKFLSLVYGPTYCDKWYMTRQFTISASTVVLVLPLCFPRRIDFLKYASVVGAIAVLYCVVIVTVKWFTTVPDADSCPIAHGPATWTDVFTVIPVICFGYQSHVSLVPIYACSRERTFSSFSKTIVIALLLCFAVYTITASFGYLTFGSCVRPDILLSYSPTPDVLIAVIVVAIKMYMSYPIMLFVGRAAIDSVWTDIRKSPVVLTESAERQRRIIVTLVWFTTSLLIAVFIPDIGIVISLLGGLAAVFIFIFPGLCLLQLLLHGYLNPTLCYARFVMYLAMSGGFIVFGTFILGLTTTQSLMNDFIDFSGHFHPLVYNTSDYCS